MGIPSSGDSRELNIYLHLYFTFLRSGVEAKRGFEFRDLIRYASKIRRKVGNRGVEILLCAKYSVKLIWFDFYKHTWSSDSFAIFEGGVSAWSYKNKIINAYINSHITY